MGSRKLLQWILPKNLWGDRLYSLYIFYRGHRRFPEKRPIRFNDHLFRLKTNGGHYDPIIQFVTDKENAKLYIAATVGEKYVIDTYRILRHPKELDDFYPDRFPCVIKPTHGSGSIMVCTDPTAVLNREELHKWFNINLYQSKREQNCRYLKPKIIVEEFVSENGNTVPADHKIFCFHGVPRFIQVDSDRFSGLTRNFYDTSWNRILMTIKYPAGKREDKRPELLDEMLSVARKLSAPFPFVRVDLYATSTGIRVGELTFIPGGTRQALRPEEFETKWGAYLGELPEDPQT